MHALHSVDESSKYVFMKFVTSKVTATIAVTKLNGISPTIASQSQRLIFTTSTFVTWSKTQSTADAKAVPRSTKYGPCHSVKCPC